jgi:hypothetical protein
MPEHKSNPQAVLRAMLPELVPHGHMVAVGFFVEVDPCVGVLLCPAENMRTVEGKIEIMGLDPERPVDEWAPAPAGVRLVHPIGQPLAPEFCDAVIMFGTGVQDGMSKGLVTSGGQPARYRTSNVMHGELMRMPLLEWQAGHLAQLRGPVA